MASESDDLIDEAKQAFKLASEAEDENRREALDDLQFAVEEDQWPADIRRQRREDGRPCLTRNLLGPFIRQVVNDSRQNRPSIKVQPADDEADVATAHLLTGLIRNIENDSCADIAYDTGVEFSVSSGRGYLAAATDYACDDTFDMDLKIRTIANPFSIYGDPYDESFDGSEAMTTFEVEMVPQDRFKKLYKNADPIDWDELGYGRASDGWVDGTGEHRRLMVANWWRRERAMRKVVLLMETDGETAIVDSDIYAAQKEMFDKLGAALIGEREVPSYKVTVTKLSGAEVLEKPKAWAGRWIPFVPIYGHVININGKRRISSLVRSAKDAQKSYNFHHTTATELTALAPKAPFIGPKGAFKTDALKWRTANTQTWPFIEYDIVPGMGAPPQRMGFAGVPSGEVQAAQQAASDMRSIIGMYEASLGQRSNETSGRAIVARQREGDTSTFHYIDNLTRAIRQLGKILLDLIPSVYGEDRVVRVMGPDKIGRPVTLGQEQPKTNEAGEEMRDPATGEVLMHVYDVTKGKYDLVVSAGPGYTTKREEAAGQMVELIRAYPMAAPVIGDLLAKNLDWPGADEIAARLKAMMPEQAKGGDSPETLALKQNMQSVGNELEAAKRNIEMLQADRALKAREVDNEEQKLKILAYEAETKRIQAFAGKDGIGLTKEDLPGAVMSILQQLLDDPDLLQGSGQPIATPAPAEPTMVPPVEPAAPPPEAQVPPEAQPPA